jgi:molybdopterin-guanine dinucleotide biosynthesis protein A
MGREKSKLKLGKRTMLGHIRATAKATGLPVRVIRRDSVPRCGPLGGIYTALKSTPAATVLFLSCDMPLVSVELLQKLLKTKAEARFVEARSRRRQEAEDRKSASLRRRLRPAARGKGFPFLLSRRCLPVVQARILAGKFSLQGLSEQLRSPTVRLPARMLGQLFNVNTPEDWAKVRERWKVSQKKAAARNLKRGTGANRV